MLIEVLGVINIPQQKGARLNLIVNSLCDNRDKNCEVIKRRGTGLPDDASKG